MTCATQRKAVRGLCKNALLGAAGVVEGGEPWWWYEGAHHTTHPTPHHISHPPHHTEVPTPTCRKTYAGWQQRSVTSSATVRKGPLYRRGAGGGGPGLADGFPEGEEEDEKEGEDREEKGYFGSRHGATLAAMTALMSCNVGRSMPCVNGRVNDGPPRGESTVRLSGCIRRREDTVRYLHFSAQLVRGLVLKGEHRVGRGGDLDRG